MTKQTILLVHGMGTHPKGEMTKTFKKALTDRATCFGLTGFDPDKNCIYEEYNYSEYFDEIRKQFAENAAARQAGFAHLTGLGYQQKLIDELIAQEAKFGNDDFIYTHWLDVLLYGTTYFGAKIRAELAEKYNQLIANGNHRNTHIVCHSLGTAVVHDTLALLYRPGANVADGIPDYVPGNNNSASLWTFANVSRMVHLLNDVADPDNSSVAPGNAGCTNFLFNIRHELDPFTWFKRYNRQMDDLEHIENTVVKNLNTHDFYEYVTAPFVAGNMLATIYKKSFTDEKYDACIPVYKQGSVTKGVDDLKKALEAIRDEPKLDSLKKALKAYKALEEIIEEYT